MKSSLTPLLSIVGVLTSSAAVTEEWLRSCHVWPSNGGQPAEHRNYACDRAAQNAILNQRQTLADAAPEEDMTPDTVYLHLPEEKTFACPMDAEIDNNIINTNSVNVNGGSLGHHTKWILYNEATTPIILTQVNALGLEVSAIDHSTYPAHSNTAVYPHGPIVLPGKMAAIEGRQGHTFIAREYKEMAPLDAMHHADQASFNSFKSVLPRTLSYLPQETRFETSKKVAHVLGQPGRVLMKHRMGNIFVKNQSGASCPAVTEDEAETSQRNDSARDTDPDCNVLRKSLINKVGCPVDVYWSPQNKVEGFSCEVFSNHLGPLESYLTRDTRDLDASYSPLKFENSYNGHSFTARMAHDQSLVARIDLSHDTVRDCPELKRTSARVKLPVDVSLVMNATEPVKVYNEWSVVGMSNATDPVMIPKIVYESKNRGIMAPTTLAS